MEKFSQWFIEFFKMFITNIWNIIKGFFTAIYNLIIGYPIEYARDFAQASKAFNFIEWVLSVISILIFLIVIFLLVVVIYQLVVKYIRFTKIEHQKLDLLNRINILERNQRFGKINDDSTTSSGLSFSKKPKTNEVKEVTNRFVRLLNIDEKYKYSVLPTYMKEEDKLTLSQLVTRIRNFASSKHNLFYSERIIAEFLAGMATSRIMILEGISGTGKTSLPYVFGKFIENDAKIISVQPSWRDRFEMMGYLNEFTKKFNETEFLTALYESTYRTDINIIVLDEMNLARVEYYFADFLSLLELPNEDEWLLEVVSEQLPGDPVNLKGGIIKIPNNVWFVGTANKDDSTFTITDKVYDRAASIEMNDRAKAFSAPKTEGLPISYKYINELFELANKKYQVSNKTLELVEIGRAHV